MAERVRNELPTPLRPLYAQIHASKTGKFINYDSPHQQKSQNYLISLVRVVFGHWMVF